MLPLLGQGSLALIATFSLLLSGVTRATRAMTKHAQMNGYR
jgi:hypothetical protein